MPPGTCDKTKVPECGAFAAKFVAPGFHHVDCTFFVPTAGFPKTLLAESITMVGKLWQVGSGKRTICDPILYHNKLCQVCWASWPAQLDALSTIRRVVDLLEVRRRSSEQSPSVPSVQMPQHIYDWY